MPGAALSGWFFFCPPTLPTLSWLLLCFCLGTGVGGKWRGRQPEFGPAEVTIKVQEGQTARLPCVVFHLNDRAVTWLRRRDLHILTTGHHTYSADDRFQVVHRPGSDEWTLVVSYAQLRDSGIYECQVNTDPKLSRPVTLNVYDSSQPISVTKSKVFVANNTASTKDGHLRVEIKGPRELYIEEGSSLTLSCLVTSSYGPSTLIYWYHDTRLIDYSSARGGIKLQIDHEKGETTARLVVESVGPEDSGMYSCVPPGSHPASVRVHVHQGKQEAAIQQGVMNETSASTRLAPFTLVPCLLLLLLLLLCLPHLLLFLPPPHSHLPILPCLVLCVSATQAKLSFLHCFFIYVPTLLLSQPTFSLVRSYVPRLILRTCTFTQYLRRCGEATVGLIIPPFTSALRDSERRLVSYSLAVLSSHMCLSHVLSVSFPLSCFALVCTSLAFMTCCYLLFCCYPGFPSLSSRAFIATLLMTLLGAVLLVIRTMSLSLRYLSLPVALTAIVRESLSTLISSLPCPSLQVASPS
ncbi:uncharacterized protein [Panulirus ornatus]|uniref:uncharacterized protein n=1 Tax=Panulirus ornatus TaxID=150431 RepID=UPI003A8C4697